MYLQYHFVNTYNELFQIFLKVENNDHTNFSSIYGHFQLIKQTGTYVLSVEVGAYAHK